MSADSPSNSPRGPNWLLRRADQAAVAVLVLAGLAATIGWWVSQGGWQGRLIEVERAEPRVARFQVDVNQADWPELAQLPGIGPVLAQRIIESRQTDGPFRTHDDLLRVRGIGPKTLEQIRPYLLPVPSPSSPGRQ
jgi:competence protein ComEA